MTNETKTKNLKKKVEIDQESLHEMIEKIAYEIYEQREKEHGKDCDDWFEAEKIAKRKSKNK